VIKAQEITFIAVEAGADAEMPKDDVTESEVSEEIEAENS
jgi:hypothetical protein